MTDKSQRPEGQDGVLSSLNTAIDGLNLAKERPGIAPAKAAFGSARDLLTLIRDSTIKEADYVELGMTCADICAALERGMDGRRADQLSQPVLRAIEHLSMTMTGIQRHIIRRGKRNMVSQLLHAKDDKKTIATWRLGLDRTLHVFNTELVTNTQPTISGIHSDINTHAADHNIPSADANIVSEVRSDTTDIRTVGSDVHRNKPKDAGGKNQGVSATHTRTVAEQSLATAQAHASAPGESPPPPPSNPRGTISNVRRDISGVHCDVMNTQTVVYDIHKMLKSQEGTSSQPQSAGIARSPSRTEHTASQTQNSSAGESPPPPPRVFFGRDELIETIVAVAGQLTPVALIGAGGIGKTSVVLTVLHNDRIKKRFGEDRRFIRCDQFPPSRAHLLRRLSKAIGAGIENPEDLIPLRPFLSSKEMLIVLDNAESILDSQGTDVQGIYDTVDELSQFSNICLCITSRISTIPPACQALKVPALSVEAAHDTFYRIYKHHERSDPINDILEQLDFHPLSVTLLATVAQHNEWDVSRLVREWGRQRTGVLCARHSRSLAATIELSLASPMFRELGPDAHGLLGVVAFFPQGVNEENVDWLFPAISDAPNMFDNFCILSLTYRANGFITMLAPLRDHLHPEDPKSSSLLSTAKERYFARLSADIYPGKPGFEELRWITLEDVNVEHMLDVFTSIGENSEGVWNACADFMNHLYQHKRRLVMLGPKIEVLPEDHPSKAKCLYNLSRLFYSVGNRVEQKRHLVHALKLWGERGDDRQVAVTLRSLSEANRQTGFGKEGVRRAREASEIFERLGDVVDQAESLTYLAWALWSDNQSDAAREAASRAIDLLPEKGEEYRVCHGHRILGEIYNSTGDTEEAIHHFELVLGIASSLNMVDQLFWVHLSLAQVFSRQGRFDDAHAHVERAKFHAVNNAYLLARASSLEASIWDEQHRPKEAKSEALRALDAFEKLGATRDAEWTRDLLRWLDARGS